MSPVELTAGELALKPYGRQHDVKTVAWLNDPRIGDSFGISRNVTLESHRTWLESARDTLIWAVLHGKDGHCGNTLLHCNWRHRSAYFQIYLGEPSVRGRGLGRTVLRLVLANAFGSLELNRVWLHTLPGNAAAERLYAKAGFVDEGLEREALFKAGAFVSQRRWSMLAREWRGREEGNRP